MCSQPDTLTREAQQWENYVYDVLDGLHPFTPEERERVQADILRYGDGNDPCYLQLLAETEDDRALAEELVNAWHERYNRDF